MKKGLIIIYAFLMCLPISLKKASAIEFRQIELNASSIIADPVSGTLYAAIPGSEAEIGNSIIPIDPATGELGTAVFVGSEPGPLAISDTGTTLYVSLDGAFAIRQVNLTTMTAGLQFSLGSSPHYGPYRAEDIEVQPGNPDVIAVSLIRVGVSPRHGGVAIFDNGVQRPNTTRDHTGANRIEFSSLADTIYGYNNESTEYGFRELRVDQDGVTETGVWRDFIRGFRVDIEFHDGRIYATTGIALEPSGPTILGTYAGVGYSEGVVANSSENLVYFLVSDGYENFIETFDLDTFILLDRIPVPGVYGDPYNLVQWGPGALAFLTDEGQVFIVDLNAEPPDSDEDGYSDDNDNCPKVSNGDQLDWDDDGLGDACDPFPRDANNEAAQCAVELGEALNQLEACLFNADSDDDGEYNDTDWCPATEYGEPVDASGCSIEQFCSQYTAKKDCLKADWKNDEPAVGKPKDCMAVKVDKKEISCQPYVEK